MVFMPLPRFDKFSNFFLKFFHKTFCITMLALRTYATAEVDKNPRASTQTTFAMFLSFRNACSTPPRFHGTMPNHPRVAGGFQVFLCFALPKFQQRRGGEIN